MMKKILVLFFLFTSLNLFAQENWVEYYVNKSISLLGRTVPSDFQRLGGRETGFVNDENIVVITENNIIVTAMIGDFFNCPHEAHEHNGFFYDYFETNNWQFIATRHDGTIYFLNGIYSMIDIPRKRDDTFVTMIAFTRDRNLL